MDKQSLPAQEAFEIVESAVIGNGLVLNAICNAIRVSNPEFRDTVVDIIEELRSKNELPEKANVQVENYVNVLNDGAPPKLHVVQSDPPRDK